MEIAEAKFYEYYVRLSPDDRERFHFELTAFGNAVMRENDKGEVVFVPLAEVKKEAPEAD